MSKAPIWPSALHLPGTRRTGFSSCASFTGVFGVWSLYRLRVRQVARTISTRFDERLAETQHAIARELHDTLLQSFHGLIFRFQSSR